MKLLNTTKVFSALLCAVGLTLFFSCKDNTEKDTSLVINEVMASNMTGMPIEGKMYNWIEICNVSDRDVSLKDYALSRDSGKVTFSLPDVTVKADECVVVYATKKNLKDQVCCDFSISKSKDTIQIVNLKGDVVSEVISGKFKNDQVLMRTNKGKYEKSYSPTPGYANDENGRKQYLAELEKTRQGQIRIWEYMSKDSSVVSDENSKGYDWVEIKNVSDSVADLTQYSLRGDTAKLSLPQKTLAPGAILLVKDLNEKIKSESVVLEKDDKFVDGVCAGETYLNISIGHVKGQDGLFFFDVPTPGKENTSKAFPGITEKPVFKKKAGVYKQDSLYVSLKSNGATVYYTTDGTIPTTSSPVYKDSILIDSSTIVRAFAVDSLNLRSKMVTATYLLNEKHTLPVVSITMDDEDLFSEAKGIYATGPNASPESPHKGANFWKPWEKCAHIEFFDGSKGFSYDCGVKIFGAYSRGRDKKSFHIKFRERYGEPKLKYDLYNRGKEDEVKSFVLRSGSQDDKGTMVRDEFFTTLMGENSPTLHIQANRPVVVYLNGKYWGVYFIREKINDEYVANHLNCDKDLTTLLVANGTPQVGTNAEYHALEQYVRTHDMCNPEVYKYMDSQIDFQSLIDYKIGEFYTGNCDVGNIRFFKTSDPKANNKWHWLYYDLDWGFYYFTPLSFYIRENNHRASGTSLAPYNMFIDRLLKNPQFRKLFLERWSFHRKNTLAPQHAVALFDKMTKTIEPEMQRNCERWPQMSYQKWQKNVANFRTKIAERLPKLEADVLKELSVTAAERKQYFN